MRMSIGACIRPLLLASLAALAGCQEPLFSGLDEVEANQMRQHLMAQGIDADKQRGDDGKHTLVVSSSDVGRALRELERAGLPRHKFSSTIDVLRSDSLVANPAEDRARLAWALSQEIAATVSTIEGVVSARVHLVLPEKPAFGAPRSNAPLASASVFVKHRPGHNLNAVSLAIRQLVAKSVEGLAPEQVSVTLMPAGNLAHETPGRRPHPGGSALPALTALAAFALGLAVGWFGALAWQKKAGGSRSPVAWWRQLLAKRP